MSDGPKLLTVAEVAERLSLKAATMRKMILERRIDTVRPSRRAVRIPEAAVRRIIDDGFLPAVRGNRPGCYRIILSYGGSELIDDGLSDPDFDNIAGGEPLPWQPPGVYPARLLRQRKKIYSPWGEKKIFDWQVYISNNLNEHVELSRFYPVIRDERDSLIFGPHSCYRKDWIDANYGRLPGDLRRFPPSVFKGRLFWVEIETVTRDQNNRPLSKSCHWSKVKRVIRPVEGGDVFAGLPIQAVGF